MRSDNTSPKRAKSRMSHTSNHSLWSSVERPVLSLQQCRYHLLYPSYDNVKHYIRKNYRMADRGLFNACNVTHLVCHDQRNRVGFAPSTFFTLCWDGSRRGAPPPDRRCVAQTLFWTGIMISIVGRTQCMSLSAPDNRYLPSEDHGGHRPWPVGQTAKT